MTSLPFLDGVAVAVLGPAAAVAAVEAALRSGLDPAAGVARTGVPVAHGELLLMPSETPRHVGVKLATVAPGNLARGLSRISAVYVLFDGLTLAPVALLDGVALTSLRTPAVSVAAARPFLQRRQRPWRVVLFGTGPQGLGHLRTLGAIHALAGVDVVVRSLGRRFELPGDLPAPRLRLAGSPEAAEALRAADVVVCATSAREPLFDSALLGPATVVLAVGSHEPEAREVDAAFAARATVVVEDRATALREGGDVVQAVAAGALRPVDLVPMAEVVTGRHPVGSGPVLFKGSGMAWQDLVVAEAVLTSQPG